MKIVLCALLLLIQIFNAKTGDPGTVIAMIEKYIRHKNLKSCTFLMCWTFNDIKVSLKLLTVPTSFWTLEKYLLTTFELERNNMLYVIDNNCRGSHNILKKAADSRKMKYKQKWLILTNSSDENIERDMKMEFGNMHVRFDSDIKVVTSSLTIFDIYNTGFGKNGTLVINNYGFWNNLVANLIIDDSPNRYHKKSILSGVTLKSSTVITNPQMNYSVADYLQERKSVDMISKFTTQILKHFREMHNFTYILFVRDKWYGNDKFGYEDGVAKDIQEETIDFAGAVAVVKYPRLLVYDFINPTYRFSAAFIFRNIQQHDLWENEFLKPFSTGTWLSILFVLTLLSALLKITNWLENTYMRTTNRYSIFTTILIVLSILCQQGSTILPSRLSSRFIFFIILVLSYLLYNYYTSSIVSALLNIKPKELMTFQDLINSGLELGIQDAPYTLTILETNMNEDIQTIRSLVYPKGQHPHIWNYTDGLRKVQTGPYAYHMETSMAYSAIEKTFNAQEICSISDKIALIPESRIAFWLKKDAQYRNLLKISLRKMEEIGIMHRNRQIWEGKKPPCFSNTILVSVGLDQTFLAFFLLLIGYIIAIMILISERASPHSKQH